MLLLLLYLYPHAQCNYVARETHPKILAVDFEFSRKQKELIGFKKAD